MSKGVRLDLLAGGAALLLGLCGAHLIATETGGLIQFAGIGAGLICLAFAVFAVRMSTDRSAAASSEESDPGYFPELLDDNSNSTETADDAAISALPLASEWLRKLPPELRQRLARQTDQQLSHSQLFEHLLAFSYSQQQLLDLQFDKLLQSSRDTRSAASFSTSIASDIAAPGSLSEDHETLQKLSAEVAALKDQLETDLYILDNGQPAGDSWLPPTKK